jgi:hypothetical protein
VTEKLPKITSLEPVVLPDKRRVRFDLVVDNLPTLFSNVAFTMPGLPANPPTNPARPAANNTPSPYPNIELSILDSQRRQVATTFIVEHKEKHTSLTLHLRRPDLDEQYIARAEMTYQDKMIDVIEVPFTLEQAD